VEEEGSNGGEGSRTTALNAEAATRTEEAAGFPAFAEGIAREERVGGDSRRVNTGKAEAKSLWRDAPRLVVPLASRGAREPKKKEEKKEEEEEEDEVGAMLLSPPLTSSTLMS